MKNEKKVFMTSMDYLKLKSKQNKIYYYTLVIHVNWRMKTEIISETFEADIPLLGNTNKCNLYRGYVLREFTSNRSTTLKRTIINKPFKTIRHNIPNFLTTKKTNNVTQLNPNNHILEILHRNFL